MHAPHGLQIPASGCGQVAGSSSTLQKAPQTPSHAASVAIAAVAAALLVTRKVEVIPLILASGAAALALWAAGYGAV